MITGFNTDIEHEGRVFHVQTEEKGRANPVVVTLVYCGGEIVTSMEASYEDLVASEPFPEDEIRRRMREQHQGLILSIRRGRYTPAQMPFGHELVSGRSLDELVLDYLEQAIPDKPEACELAAEADAVPSEGEWREEDPERRQKVERVLHRLEAFLSAAERAKVEPLASLPSTVAVAPEPQAEPVSEALRVEPEAPARSRPRRGPLWVWAIAVAAMIVGAVALFLLDRHGATEVASPSPTSREADIPTSPAEPPSIERAGLAPPTSSAVSDESSEHTAPVEAEPEPVVETLPTRPPVRRPSKAATQETAPSSETPKPSSASARDQAPAPVRPPAPNAQESSAPEAVSERPDPQPVAAPPIEAGQLVDPSEVDLQPNPRTRALPRYTRRARRLQQEGVVELSVLIDQHGKVAQVRLVQGIADSDLNDAAVAVASGWSFSPARKDGLPVQMWKDVAIEFSIRPDRTTSVRMIRE